MTWKELLALLGFFTLCAAPAGCGQAPATSETSAPDATYVAASEPAGAIPVGEARQSAADREPLVLVGRIGGSPKPFIDDMAVFTIVDPEVRSCVDEEGCPTPWDYCCTQDQVKENIATVKVVDSQGSPLATDARRLLGVKELNLVVVQGEARRDDAGNLSLLAGKVFVKE